VIDPCISAGQQGVGWQDAGSHFEERAAFIAVALQTGDSRVFQL